MAQNEEVRVPDIGDFDEVDVVEILVSKGDHVDVEQSLITLESEKASLEVPSPVAGVVRKIKTSVGDKVSEGTVIVVIEVDGDAQAKESSSEDEPEAEAAAESPAPEAEAATESTAAEPEAATESAAPEPAGTSHETDETDATDATKVTDEPRPHASPSVRRMARELGVDLGKVAPSGPKGRVLSSDIRGFVKHALRQPGSSGGLPPLPEFDPAKFGPVEIVALSKINKLTARNVHRSWLHIPHVTHFDEADITGLEEFRRAHAAAAEAKGFKLTFVSFVARATAAALLSFPRFNSSLLADGENLALRRYVNIGVAVDTEQGLLVPVVHDADKKSVLEIAAELAELSEKARAGKLGPRDMQGATFTISSLGGIGGSGFTPIINSPEVAILGVSRAQTRPVYVDGAFVPRLVLPLALSYDHRVIDGAAAARFTRHLCELLEDLRRVLL